MLLVSNGCNPWEDEKDEDSKEDDDWEEGDAGGEDGEKGDGICDFCDNEEQKRHVLGLVMHPAEKPGGDYRVGVFELRVEQAGGSYLFNGREDVWICLV